MLVLNKSIFQWLQTSKLGQAANEPNFVVWQPIPMPFSERQKKRTPT